MTVSSCGYFRVLFHPFWAARACQSDAWTAFLATGSWCRMYRKHEKLRGLSSLYGTTSLWCSLSMICSSRIKAPEGLWQGFSSDLMPLHLVSCRLPGTAWWGNPTWSKCLTLGCQGKGTGAVHCPLGLSQHGELSIPPSFPLPGLSWMISTPAPQAPSFQSSGLPQRFSPTATTAPNLTFGHLVRNSCQNGENSTAPAGKNRGLIPK